MKNALIAMLTLFLGLILAACGSQGETPVPADGDGDSEAASEATCGNGTCEAGENCLSCPADCTCRCGDGICTYGEFYAVCPADCPDTLAATPPMGWSTWNAFACAIDETMAREMADAFVSSGFKAAGYRYLNLDDCWQTSRTSEGRIVAAADRFASGIPALADYVHDKGLLFGLYTCVSTKTCQEKPGSQGYETNDAAAYAEWKVDFIKEDWCFHDDRPAYEQYKVMHDALAGVSYPILFSICNWGQEDSWLWAPAIGQIWRTTLDIKNSYLSVMFNYSLNVDLAPYAAPGHFNDPDMLEVGNGKLSAAENRTHMAWWAIMAAPLIAGNDLRTMDADTKAVLLNPEVIAVDQDPAGLQGVRVVTKGDLDVIVKPLTETGARAVVVSNSGADTQTTVLPIAKLGLVGEVALRDLWTHTDLGRVSADKPLTLAPHESVFYKATGTEPAVTHGESALSAWPAIYSANAVGPVEIDRSLGTEKAGDGGPLRLAGQSYATGLGVSASAVVYHLGGACTHLHAVVGVDDEVTSGGNVGFEVWGDGKELYASSTMSAGTAPATVEVDLTGVIRLKLRVTPGTDGLDGDHADWADLRITCR